MLSPHYSVVNELNEKVNSVKRCFLETAEKVCNYVIATYVGAF